MNSARNDMNYLKAIIFILIFSPNIAYAGCKEGVSKQINQNGYLKDSDRARLLDDCKKFQDFRLGVKENPKGAYILNKGSFTCRKREDYIKAYNWVLERGGKYNPSQIDKYKSCRAIKTPTLVALRTQEDPNDPVVKILYASKYSVYYLHSQWVYDRELVPYSSLLKGRLK